MIKYLHNQSNGTGTNHHSVKFSEIKKGFSHENDLINIFKSVLTNHKFNFFYQSCFSNDFYFHFGFYFESDFGRRIHEVC